MNTLMVALVVAASASLPGKRYKTEYFVKKHNLTIPQLTEPMFDTSKLIHASDSWTYTYIGSTSKIDVVHRFLNIERFPASDRIEKYAYKSDTIIIEAATVQRDSGDTSTHAQYRWTDNGKREMIYDYKDRCSTSVGFMPWGIRIQNRAFEIRKCAGDQRFSGQVFLFKNKGDYIESIEEYRGVIDSNSMRRYYFNSIDSVVARFIESDREAPRISNLKYYSPSGKLKTSFSFSHRDKRNGYPVSGITHYTYRPDGQEHIVYEFDLVDAAAVKKAYRLVNYTEHTYDSLGRLIKQITRVVPDSLENRD